MHKYDCMFGLQDALPPPALSSTPENGAISPQSSPQKEVSALRKQSSFLDQSRATCGDFSLLIVLTAVSPRLLTGLHVRAGAHQHVVQQGRQEERRPVWRLLWLLQGLIW